MSKSILTFPLTSTPALDKALAQHAEIMAKVDQTQAKANAIIDRAFNKVNRVLDAATAKVLQFGL